MPNVSRINPLSIAPGGTAPTANDMKYKPVQSITMGIRIGNSMNAELGLVQSFNWSIARNSSELYQIEAVPNTGAPGESMSLSSTPEFVDSAYWPGEVIEVIPGKQGAASLTLHRCTMYGSNLLSALMYLQNAGNVGDTVAGSEIATLKDLDADTFHQFVTLCQQVRPIYIKQVFFNPISGKIAYGREFQDCWIEDLKENIPEANDNKVVIEEMTVKATRIRPLQKAIYS